MLSVDCKLCSHLRLTSVRCEVEGGRQIRKAVSLFYYILILINFNFNKLKITHTQGYNIILLLFHYIRCYKHRI